MSARAPTLAARPRPSAPRAAPGAARTSSPPSDIGYRRLATVGSSRRVCRHPMGAPILPSPSPSPSSGSRDPRAAAAVPDDDAPVPSTSPSTPAAVTYVERAVSPREAWRRMWTRSDRYHVHGNSCSALTMICGYVIAAWAKLDLGALGVIDDHGASANAVRDALEAHGGGPDLGIGALAALAGVCALSGTPLGTRRGWRKVELSARSTLFQLVLTWQALRLGPGGECLAALDDRGGALRSASSAWQCVTRRTSSRSRTTTSARRCWCWWGRGCSARRCSPRRASSRARGAWTRWSRRGRARHRLDALAARAGVAAELEHARGVDEGEEGDRRRGVPSVVLLRPRRRGSRLRAGRLHVSTVRVDLEYFATAGAHSCD